MAQDRLVKQPKFLFFCSESFTSYVLYSRFLEEYEPYLAAVYEYPHLEFSTAQKADRSVRILKRSAISFFLFKTWTIVGFKVVGLFYKRRLRDFCKKHRIPYHRCARGITSAVVDSIKAYQPEVIFNASAQILKENVLSIPPSGVINFHGAKLPEYRGAANYFWVLVNNEQTTCATLHYVEKGLDTGPIIAYGEEIPIAAGASVFEIYLKVLRSGYHLQSAFFERLIAREAINALPQSEENAVIRSLPGKNDVKKLRENGHRVIKFADLIAFYRIIQKGPEL